MKRIKRNFFFFILLNFLKVFCFSQTDETYEKLGVFVDVMEIIDTNYVLETKSQNLVISAMKGMVGSLDQFRNI
ncbi:MAG: hypothetical protein LBI80_01035 [Endomicrobium sp.]|jgi:hypothetical protein|nr:hypothetical protein [Endomicrobium sp.]